MRILYIVPFVPWPVRVRSFNLIPRLARHHEIHLVCTIESPQSLTRLDGLGAICRSVRFAAHSSLRGMLQCMVALPTPKPLRLAYCRSPRMSAIVKRAVDEVAPDVIYVERWRALQYVPAGLRIPVVCDPTDSMILYNRRLATMGAWWERLIGLEEYVKFLRAEPRLAARVDATIFCSRVDMDCVLRRDSRARCEIVPNGVDCQKFFLKQSSEIDPHTIVFTGSFDYRPNRQAVRYFLRDIFPSVRKSFPSARFHAVGNAADKHLRRFRQPGFEATDFVADLRNELAKATVAIAPMTVGSGVSNKLLEAFATGTPVVATSIACGDLPVRDGEHLLVANDPRQFADAIIALMGGTELRGRLTVAARRLVVEGYDWEIVYQRMERVLLSVADLKSPGSTADRGVRIPAVAGL
jgi:glycosyltransferase involved in cell wall biosynthesis